MVGKKKYRSVDHLKSAILREWKRIPEDHIRAACNEFYGRLDAIIRAEGQHIENLT